MLIVVFSLMLGWLPPYGLRSWKGYIMPVIVLATEQMAVLTRVMRSSTVEVLNQDYVRTATAKGLPRYTWSRCTMRCAMLCCLSSRSSAFRIAFLLSGTIVVETIFALPGIGRLFTDSVFRLDYQVVQSLVVIFAVLVVVVNLLTDLVYALVDPRDSNRITRTTAWQSRRNRPEKHRRTGEVRAPVGALRRSGVASPPIASRWSAWS